jgi:hypothetical protein
LSKEDNSKKNKSGFRRSHSNSRNSGGEGLSEFYDNCDENIIKTVERKDFF